MYRAQEEQSRRCKCVRGEKGEDNWGYWDKIVYVHVFAVSNVIQSRSYVGAKLNVQGKNKRETNRKAAYKLNKILC